MNRRSVAIVLLVVVVASCGESAEGGGSGPFPLEEADLAAAEAYFSPIDAEQEAFDSLQASGDTSDEAIRRFVESVYSPDVVFHDASFGDHREGHDDVVSMYRTFLYYFGDAVVEDRPTLVGDPTALEVIPFWDLQLGPTEFTEEAPLIEVDLEEIDGGLISSLRLFYDLTSLRTIYGDLPAIDGALQQQYADAWESGSTEAIAALYDDGAVRHDGLAGLDATGVDEITAEAERWSAALRGATWTVQLPFGDRFGDEAGAVFEVSHDGCVVVVGILFDLDDDGRIAQERLHYDPVTLRACGWVD